MNVSTNEDITICFAKRFHGDGSANAFDGRGGILAHTYYPAVAEPLNGDIHFDDDEKWTRDGQGGKFVFTYETKSFFDFIW